MKIRKEKAKESIPLSQEIEIVTITGSTKTLRILEESIEDIRNILHINSIRYKEGETIKIKID